MAQGQRCPFPPPSLTVLIRIADRLPQHFTDHLTDWRRLEVIHQVKFRREHGELFILAIIGRKAIPAQGLEFDASPKRALHLVGRSLARAYMGTPRFLWLGRWRLQPRLQ